MNIDVAGAPLRESTMLPVELWVQRRSDGTILLRSRVPIEVHERWLPQVLAGRAAAHPGRPFLLQRHGPAREWHPLTYGQAQRDVAAVAQWLLDRGCEAPRSVMILSGNSIAHAVIRFGAMAAGVPACPVSATYAMLEGAWPRLQYVVDLVRPAVVFVEHAAPAAGALRAVDFRDAVLVTATPDVAPAGAFDLADVLHRPPTGEVVARTAALRGDDAAAYMLTSGSTGNPKAVVVTHRMLAANAAQAQQTLGAAAGWDGVTMDWLPWSHASGAASMYTTLAAGGTLYIDEGKPLGPYFGETLRNLREVGSAYHVNVPLGYAMLADALEADADLRSTFFRDLRVMLYGGAGLPQPVYDRLQRLAVATVGQRIPLASAYGSTETTAGCLAVHFPSDRVGIGLPMPGITVKLVPVDTRYEIRIAGPVVTPGYLRDPDRTQAAFDEEGYFCLGDLVTFHDPAAPEQGLAFAGRVAEEFKLGSGTWVSAGSLRAAVLQALAPWVAEAVICGDDRNAVGVLAWPDRAALQREFGLAPDVSLDSPPAAALRDAVRARLAAYNAAHPGASTRIAHFAWLSAPPALAASELSDKGTINRAAVLRHRAADVERLYQGDRGLLPA